MKEERRERRKVKISRRKETIREGNKCAGERNT